MFAQRFYNTIDIEPKTFPNELQNINNWIASEIEGLFYSGYILEQRYFRIVSKSSETPSVSISSIGMTLSLDMENNAESGRYQSKDLKLFKDNKSKRISRYHVNFDFKKLVEPKYYFQYALDLNYLNDYELLKHSIGYIDEKETQIKVFFQRLNHHYQTNFTIDDLSKYQYTETLEEYQKRYEREYNFHWFEPRGERTRIEQLIELIENEFLWLINNDTIEDIIYSVYIQDKNITIETKNLNKFLKKLFGNENYKENINQTLVQEYKFYDFPAKIYFDRKGTKVFNKKSNLSIDTETYFEIKQADFIIKPNDENSSFEIILNGKCVTSDDSLRNIQKIFISLSSKKVKIKIFNNKRNKVFEIVDKKHKL